MNRDFQELTAVSTTGIAPRIGLVLLLVLTAALSWFAIGGQLGRMLADVSVPTDENAAEISELAASFSPRDPLVNWLKAAAQQDQDPKNVAGFENAARLAPADYRIWGQLGRSYELADQPEKAEAAFKHAINIAPQYVLPRWQIGNFYLRLGRESDAMRELGLAAERDPVYRDQVFSIVYDFFERDTEKLEELAGSKPGVVAGLAKFYAAKGLPRLSLRAWNRLNASQRAAHKDVSELIAQSLYDKWMFRTSVEFVGQSGDEKGARTGSIFNGGFETEILEPGKTRFSWKITKTEGFRAQTDRFKKHGGSQSLKVEFNGVDEPGFNNIYQVVAVESGKRYRLSFWIKTDRLVSAGLPLLEVINPSEGVSLAKTKAFPAGSNEWQKLSVEFRVPDRAEGVSIRTVREFCGEKCVLQGAFWYDDFELTKLD